jgi:transcriptional regulator with XRE-family HTH domain
MSDQKKFLKAVGKKIDKYRKERELSFSELSALCDIEKAVLVRITSNGTNITISTLYKISKGLDVPVHELLKF